MIELAIILRAINLYSHHAHNMCKGDEFFQDHAFFKDLYVFADDSYDSIVERHLGTTSEDLDLNLILKESSSLISSMSDDYMNTLLLLIQETANGIDEASKDAKLSSGTVNMLQGISDQIEVFVYKIKRRLM